MDGTMKLWMIENIPGKGLGLITVQDIPRGTRIISEGPLFTIPGFASAHLFTEELVASKLRLLSKEEQRSFLSLHNNFLGTPHPLSGVVKTNALPLGPGAQEGGVFPNISRINHSCRSNCQNTWNDNLQQETIHAVRPIVKGEEITIAYTAGPSTNRRRHLKTKFGFDCTCELCILSETKRATSDRNIQQIERLDNVIGDGSRLLQNPKACLKDCHSLLLLLEAESIMDARVPRLYYDAFQIVIAHGDKARASVFAEKACAARLCCEGEDSPLTIKLKELIRTPESHRLFGTSRRWKSTIEMIPTTIVSETFEKWLWKLDTKFN